MIWFPNFPFISLAPQMTTDRGLKKDSSDIVDRISQIIGYILVIIFKIINEIFVISFLLVFNAS